MAEQQGRKPSAQGAGTDAGQRKPTPPAPQGSGPTADEGVQGEGNYEASRRYREDVGDFVRTADINKAARDAAPRSKREADEMAAAEAAGRERRKGS